MTPPLAQYGRVVGGLCSAGQRLRSVTLLERERGPNSQTSEFVGECGDGVKLARKKPKSPFGKSGMSVSADEDAAHGDVDHGG